MIFINLQGFPSRAAQNYHREAHHRNCKYLEAAHSILAQSEGFSEHSLSRVGGETKPPKIFPTCLNWERLINVIRYHLVTFINFKHWPNSSNLLFTQGIFFKSIPHPCASWLSLSTSHSAYLWTSRSPRAEIMDLFCTGCW